jgi:hypothetical protein
MLRIAARGACAALLVMILMPVAAERVSAQITSDFLSGPRFGIGYHAVVPDVLAGAGAWYLSGPRRFGVFVDGKFTVPNPAHHANYCPPGLGNVPCNVEAVQANFNHWQLRDREHWTIFNAGGMYAVSREFAVMLGGGMARRNLYREYIDDEDDDTVRITWEGNYLVPMEPRDEWVAQLTVGGLVRAGNRVGFSVGYETAPASMSIGVFVMLP